MENGEVGDLGSLCLRLGAITNHIFYQSFLSVKTIFHRKKATSSIHNSNNKTSAFLEDNHHTLVYSTEALCVFAILSQ